MAFRRDNLVWGLLLLATCLSVAFQVTQVLSKITARPPAVSEESKIDRRFEKPGGTEMISDPTLPINNTTQYTYDAENRLTSVKTDEPPLVALREVTDGRLSYITPTTMKTGQKERIIARIAAKDIPTAALQRGFGDHKSFYSETVETPITVKMRMRLVGGDFDVTALNSEEQIVGGKSPTQWEWMVSPKASGKLHLTLDAVAEIAGTGRDFTTIERDIVVAVDPVFAAKDFAAKNWQWILSTLAAGIALWWKFFGPKDPPTIQSQAVAVGPVEELPSKRVPRERKSKTRRRH